MKTGLLKYLFFLKEWEFLNVPPCPPHLIAHVSSPAAGHAWEGAILPDYGRCSGALGP